jgi:PAS domain S-box-containing protein
VSRLRIERGDMQIILDEIPVVTLLIDHSQNIVFCNAACEKVFGYTKEELLGCNINMLVETHLRDKHTRQIEEYMKKPVCCPLGIGRDFKAVCKGGFLKHVEISLVPIEVEGIQYILATIIDIEIRTLLSDIKETAKAIVAKRECLLEVIAEPVCPVKHSKTENEDVQNVSGGPRQGEVDPHN